MCIGVAGFYSPRFARRARDDGIDLHSKPRTYARDTEDFDDEGNAWRRSRRFTSSV